MSREKRARREQRRQDSQRNFVALVMLVADGEGQTLVGIDDFELYIRDLKARGILVERGPRLRDGGQPLSFRFDQMRPGSREITREDLIAIFGNLDFQGRGAVA